MGKRLSKERKASNRQEFVQLTDYLMGSPNNITLKAIGEKLNVAEWKLSQMRNSNKYVVRDEDIEALRHTYREELAGFGEPTEVEKELSRLRAELAALREKVGKKESLNEQLQELLIEAQRRIKELGG